MLQKQVYAGMAIGTPGEKWSNNPEKILSRLSEAAVVVGRFAFPGTDTATKVKNSGRGGVLGLVIKSVVLPITTFLAESTVTSPAVWQTEVSRDGDRMVVGSGVSVFGDKVFASYIDGQIVFDDAGATVSSSEGTMHIIATNMTVDTKTAGTVIVGQKITRTGVAAETYVVSQTSGTAGGAGVYVVSVSQTVNTALAPDAFVGTNYVETPFKVIEGGADAALIKIAV